MGWPDDMAANPSAEADDPESRSSASGNPGRRKRGRPKCFDEAAVMDISLTLFLKQGFAGTSLDEIAAATGVSRPSLAATFGDKEAIYLRSLAHYDRRVSARLDAILVGDGAVANLWNSLNRYFDVMIETYTDAARGGGTGCVLIATGLEASKSHQAILGFLQSSIARFDERFLAFFETAEAAGKLTSGQSPSAMSHALVALTLNLGARARAQAQADELWAIVTPALFLLLPQYSAFPVAMRRGGRTSPEP